MYHDIMWPQAAEATTIRIENNVLTVTAGLWPGLSGLLRVPAVTVSLDATDDYVCLDTAGGIVVSSMMIPYGQDDAGNLNPMADLLAWKQDDEWHIKRLTPGGAG